MKNILISQRISFDKKRKETYTNLDIRWFKVSEKLCFNLIPIPFSVRSLNSILAKITIDGIILSGGNNISINDNYEDYDINFDSSLKRDCLETIMIEYVMNHKIPLLGICRGMQMINNFFGGSNKVVNPKVHVKNFHKISDLDKKQIKVNSYHNFGIDENSLSKNLIKTHIAEDNTIEGFAHKDHKIFGIMWHPERNDELNVYDEKLIRKIFNI
tara:strand:- start:3163 stop:3804 length:642 start_codon:yes stop_codon:yes gene_type:complete